MEIKQAKFEDHHEVKNLLKKLDTKRYKCSSDSEMKPKLKDGRFWLAWLEGKAIGLICIQEVEKSCEIWALVSEPPGKGVGSSLISFAEECSIKKRIEKIRCWSRDCYNAKGFYKKSGFDEAYLMQKQRYNQDCWFFGKNLVNHKQ